MDKPALKRSRIILAFAIAALADILQVPITVGEATGVFLIPGELADFLLDCVVMVATTMLLGFHWMLLPTLFVEVIPGLDLLPTWTASVAYVVWRRKKTQPHPISPVIDVRKAEVVSTPSAARLTPPPPPSSPPPGTDDSDEELNRHALQLQKPVTFSDSILGTFTLDRRVDWFEAHTVWSGSPIDLHLSAKETGEVQAALRMAHSLWKDQPIWNERVRDHAVQKLLPLKNEHWLGEDETEVTPEQFKETMTLESVSVFPDGSFEFWHNDGDLFWGHSIRVSGSLRDGVQDAGIEG